MSQTFDSQALVEETEKSEDSQGWLATFADLMSLLMCFFVLLLSFSELDVVKFKQIAGSMKTAFGVQRDIEAEAIPMGTSAVFDQFSPSVNEPTLIDEVRQTTDDSVESRLAQQTQSGDRQQNQTGRKRDAQNQAYYELQEQLRDTLQSELDKGQFELDNYGQQLIIRINESGSFSSGSAFLQPMFVPALEKLSMLLATVPGRIIVSGHTDNIPVNNEMFQDNLVLSATRAIAIARVLKRHPHLSYVQANGMASSRPLVSNNSPANRAKNRRVEIAVLQGNPEEVYLSAQEANNG